MDDAVSIDVRTAGGSGSCEYTVPMVVNRCFGGFSLSEAAERELARRRGFTLKDDPVRHVEVQGTFHAPSGLVSRADPDLVAIVREMGGAADGECAELRIVGVSVSLDISSHDGMETVLVSGWSQ